MMTAKTVNDCMKCIFVTMQFMVERKDLEAISLEDCKKLSKYISTILDMENPIKNNYYLEVSSPGLERPLI